ncbi:hypothetical protein D3C75_510410 [compost metagenome]
MRDGSDSNEQSDWYDIVRRSDGKVMGSMPLDRGYLVYRKNGLVSLRPLLDDEFVFTPSSAARFLTSIGYHVSQPSDIMISTV